MIKVIYHAGCNDGFAAAWVAWKYFGDNAKYIPFSYQDDVPAFNDEDEVYVLDFSFPPLDMLEWQGRLKKFVVLDHHKTVLDDVNDSVVNMEELTSLTYDATRSGCVLAWQFFFPEKLVPYLLTFIEDRDLWNWEYKSTREVHLMISTIKLTFDNFDALLESFQSNSTKYIDIGKTLGAYEDNMVRRIVSNAYYTNFLGRGTIVPVVNTPVLQSEVGHELCKDSPYAVMWSDVGRNRIYSLRSAGKVDVGELARSLGGGGHKNAAGFVRKGYGN